MTDPKSYEDTQLGTPVPLSLLFRAAIEQVSQGRNEPLDNDEINELSAGLAKLAEGRPAVVDPQKPGTITGYNPQSPDAVRVVNSIKNSENELGARITDLREGRMSGVQVDQDLAERAAETLQVGFMLLVRSIFQPDSKLKP